MFDDLESHQNVKEMKTIAFYLPQFHSIPENDEWWGKGFTEWVNVKKSKALFRGHNQPEVPLDNNYYNLLDDDVMVKQAALAKEYGVYGFCYYHYWFEGKLLLEKPLERMLENNMVDIPFCMCWANETWSRTWSGSETEILIKQNYNESEKEWRAHFEYLLKFFKDKRYILNNNKPMLIIYKPHLITNLEQLLVFWNELAIAEGFDGIFYGFQHHSAFSDNAIIEKMDFGIEFEPWYTIDEREKAGMKRTIIQRVKRKVFGLPIIYDYDEIWKQILRRTPISSNIMPGAFTAWDNTPRRGKKGAVFFKSSPEKFKEYITKQIERAHCQYNSDYIFINAWNEWAEGAHLEPDEINRYGYLEALKAAIEADKY